MTGKTHMCIGLATATALGMINVFDVKHALISSGVVIAASLLSDVDQQNSEASQKLYFGSKAVGIIICLALIFCMIKGYLKFNITFIAFILFVLIGIISPHRSFTHSLIGCIAISIIVYKLSNKIFTIFAVGYYMHIFADCLTHEGVELLFPYRKHIGIPIVEYGSVIESLICAACLLFISVKLLVSFRII